MNLYYYYCFKQSPRAQCGSPDHNLDEAIILSARDVGKNGKLQKMRAAGCEQITA